MTATTTTTDPLVAPARPSARFGSTLFDSLVPGAAASAAPASVFDVCHVGVVLRALLFVHAVVAVGVSFVATGPASWLALAGTGSSMALPALLMWLLVACVFKAPLGALPLVGQWSVALLLGALAGAGAPC